MSQAFVSVLVPNYTFYLFWSKNARRKIQILKNSCFPYSKNFLLFRWKHFFCFTLQFVAHFFFLYFYFYNHNETHSISINPSPLAIYIIIRVNAVYIYTNRNIIWKKGSYVIHRETKQIRKTKSKEKKAKRVKQAKKIQSNKVRLHSIK